MNVKYRFARFLRRNEPIILMYHGISSYKFGFPVWTQLETELFEQQMRFLKDSGYHICRLSEFVNTLKNQETFPRNCIVLTFDDGFLNNYSEAFPILKTYEIPAAIFLTARLIGGDEIIWSDRLLYALMSTGVESAEFEEVGRLEIKSTEQKQLAYRKLVNILKRLPVDEKDGLLANFLMEILPRGADKHSPDYQAFRLMSWGDAREMNRSDLIEFGGHGCFHNILTRMTPSALAADLSECKQVIESNLGASVNLFAYPNGTRTDFDENAIRTLHAGGWESAVTTVSGRASNLDGVYEIPRLGIGAGTTLDDFRYLLSGREAWSSLASNQRPTRMIQAMLSGAF